ncbi:carbohydrate ABC transporter membrane protein 2, CUT1 family [Tranquillimonas rosea]|uniref:Carbohydrate ABC transporter membrane protein 2, CUT1 family n=1 Tax=Tranquillimonas rosea TaxID=641238 RepID=A0A1H9WL82_9RHOB|nr:carbohydrate ABC transporter permease [Tranquillimonas rosea]SES34625.1 carbohydrate ABC transporter membrane protein 2, CUT1 family [Tranquillimonas rosea]
MTDATADTPTVTAEDEETRRPLWRSILTHAVLIAASFAMLYPILWMISASFRPEEEIFTSTSLIPSQITLEAYPQGWFGLRVSFGQFFMNSLVISILSVVGNVFACSLAAFAFARLRFPGRNFFFALMLGTLMLPYHVTLIPQYVLFLNLDWVNTILPLVVPKFMAVDAFFIFLMVQFFRGIPRELDEAARMDGCSPFRIYWRVIMPLSVPVLATAAIFTFLWTWDDFFGPLIYLNDMQQYTVQLGLRSFIDSSGTSNWSGLFAMSLLSLVPVFLFFLFFQRLLIDGIATTGLK